MSAAADACAAAAAALRAVAEQMAEQGRGRLFDEAVIEAERARAADEALAAAGLVPCPRGRRLHPVS